MDLGIRDKVALVVGGTRGIGRAISTELGREGCKVVVAARRQDSLDETVAEIQAAGGQATGLSADLSILENYDRVFEHAKATFGAPDIAVFNMETPAPGRFAA